MFFIPYAGAQNVLNDDSHNSIYKKGGVKVFGGDFYFQSLNNLLKGFILQKTFMKLRKLEITF